MRKRWLVGVALFTVLVVALVLLIPGESGVVSEVEAYYPDCGDHTVDLGRCYECSDDRSQCADPNDPNCDQLVHVSENDYCVSRHCCHHVPCPAECPSCECG